MNPELEVVYHNVNHDEVRKKLKKLGFVKTQEKREYNCKYFHFEDDVKKGRERWARLKDDGTGRVLMGVKEAVEEGIGGVREIDLYVDSFEKGKEFFYSIGMTDRSCHTMTREIWKLEKENIEVTLDNWDHLEPSIEIESDSIEKLKEYSELLGFEFGDGEG